MGSLGNPVAPMKVYVQGFPTHQTLRYLKTDGSLFLPFLRLPFVAWNATSYSSRLLFFGAYGHKWPVCTQISDFGVCRTPLPSPVNSWGLVLQAITYPPRLSHEFKDNSREASVAVSSACCSALSRQSPASRPLGQPWRARRPQVLTVQVQRAAPNPQTRGSSVPFVKYHRHFGHKARRTSGCVL